MGSIWLFLASRTSEQNGFIEEADVNPLTEDEESDTESVNNQQWPAWESVNNACLTDNRFHISDKRSRGDKGRRDGLDVEVAEKLFGGCFSLDGICRPGRSPELNGIGEIGKEQ